MVFVVVIIVINILMINESRKGQGKAVAGKPPYSR